MTQVTFDRAMRAQPIRERGQGSTELLGIVVLAALLVGGLVFTVSSSDDHVSSTIRSKICEITSGGEGDCGDVAPLPRLTTTGVPTYLDPSLTPQERAESGRYVALGDSFSSGEGGSEYDPKTDENYADEAEYYWRTHNPDGTQKPTICTYHPQIPGDHRACGNDPYAPQEKPYNNTCHRSTQAYPQRVDDEYTFAGGWTFAACSGAVTADFSRPNPSNDGEPAQLDHLDAETSLVTFSIGGNDAKFADTLSGCIAAGLNPFDSCTDDDEKQAVEDDIDTALENLEKLLPLVRERAPNARILVVGYPRFFPEDPGSEWGDGTQIDHDDILFINSKVKDMDERIGQLVDRLNEEHPHSFEYVDVYDAFAGCEIGTDSPCMNNIELRWADGKPDKNGSYHPNDKGHGKLAQQVEEVIQNGS
jgi:lysophospholipase L1-like esterase